MAVFYAICTAVTGIIIHRGTKIRVSHGGQAVEFNDDAQCGTAARTAVTDDRAVLPQIGCGMHQSTIATVSQDAHGLRMADGADQLVILEGSLIRRCEQASFQRIAAALAGQPGACTAHTVGNTP